MPILWRLALVAVVLLGLALVLAQAPLPAALGMVGGAIAFVMVLAQPLLGLALLALAIPFGSPFNMQLGGINFGPTELLFGLLALAWLGRSVIARDLLNTSWKTVIAPKPVLPIIVFPLAAWLFVLALTLLVTHSLPESLKELIKWAEVLIIVLFVARTVERKHILWLLALVFVASAAESAIGLYQTATNNGPEPFFVPLGGRLIMRSYGTFEQPNPFAAYLNFTLPIMVSLLIGYAFERQLWRAEPADPPRLGSPRFALLSPRALCLVAAMSLPLVAAAFFFSLSRGAWMGFALAFVVITAFRSRRALILFVLLAIVLAGTLILGSLNILPSGITDRIADLPTFFGLDLFDPRAVLLTNENFGIVDRMAHWFAAWNMFSSNPWLGVGIGNYGVVYPLFGLREWPFSLGHAHNFYLNMLAETGIVGFSMYCVMVGSTFVVAWVAARRARGMWRALALGILGALLALAAHNFFDDLYVHGMNIQFALLLGMAARLGQPEPD
jgi:putative inorganic carbon (hco3(-)) transporter